MKLFFRKLGEGKPLFILHGLFGLSDNWATVGKILSEYFEIYLIDLRNHGGSPHSDEWTYPAMANDVYELINNQLPNYPITLLGHSLGGKVAMQFASMYPEKLKKLIVVDMAPKDYPVGDRSLIDNMLAMDLEKIKSRKEADEKISSFVKEPAVRQLLSKNLYWNEEKKLSWRFNLKTISENISEVGKTFSVKKGIQVPALFIKGEKSNYIQEIYMPAIKKIFAHSKFKTIEGAGHWVHAEKPKEFTECIKEFTT